VAAYDSLDSRGLHTVLNGIKTLIAVGDWNSAAAAVGRTRDEAHRQKSASTNKSEWRDFLVHADCLQLTIRAKDREGCAEELASLRSALVAAAGPERQT
jgi:hypothetical protein